MGKRRIKPNYPRRMLRLPDLDDCKLAVLNPRMAFYRIVVVRHRLYLEILRLAANTINQQLAAVRCLAHEAADSGLLSPELAAEISCN
ncbi:MAG TPA: hypothetical protein VN901_27710 [Candidatus Acidoferrales bacterium]|nr:hypothetical protein [Candidatus Acidoferrales bacterium]